MTTDSTTQAVTDPDQLEYDVTYELVYYSRPRKRNRTRVATYKGRGRTLHFKLPDSDIGGLSFGMNPNDFVSADAIGHSADLA